MALYKVIYAKEAKYHEPHGKNTGKNEPLYFRWTFFGL